MRRARTAWTLWTLLRQHEQLGSHAAIWAELDYTQCRWPGSDSQEEARSERIRGEEETNSQDTRDRAAENSANSSVQCQQTTTPGCERCFDF